MQVELVVRLRRRWLGCFRVFSDTTTPSQLEKRNLPTGRPLQMKSFLVHPSFHPFFFLLQQYQYSLLLHSSNRTRIQIDFVVWWKAPNLTTTANLKQKLQILAKRNKTSKKKRPKKKLINNNLLIIYSFKQGYTNCAGQKWKRECLLPNHIPSDQLQNC